MSDSVPDLNRKADAVPFAAILATGLASSVLYLAILPSIAFLLPVQIAFGRLGRRAGWASIGLAALGIVIFQGLRLSAAGVADPLSIAAGTVPPLALLCALGLVNARFWQPLPAAYRVLTVTAACALAALPMLIYLGRDASIAAYLEDRITAFLAPLRSATGDGYDASSFATTLDPKELVAQSIVALKDSYAAILLVLVGGSWRLGNRLSGFGSHGRQETTAIDELRLPYPLVWAFLGSWSLVLAVVLIHAGEAATVLSWNCAIAFTLAYAAQGFGIVTYLFKRWNMPRYLRILIAILAVLGLATQTAGLAVAILLPLIGVTELWIPYRKHKGVGA